MSFTVNNLLVEDGLTASTITATTISADIIGIGNNLITLSSSYFPSLTSNTISATTSIFSAGTDLNIFFNQDRAQINTKSNLSGATFTGQVNAVALSATTLSGGTILSGATNLYSIFSPITGQTYQATASTVTTTSLSGVMGGFSSIITPRASGNILIIICGDLTNNSNGRGSKVQIRTGTGTAPTNGSVLTGTGRGSSIRMNNSGNATTDMIIPFSTNAVVTGLILGTTYWIDLSYASIGGGTTTLADVSISVIEI